MNTLFPIRPTIKRMFANILSVFVIIMMAFPQTSTVQASAGSPFLGHWQTIDVDGSDIRLSIAGRPEGPYQITWTESYISFCNREAGIIRGLARLNESNTNLLEADLHLQCFTTGATQDFRLVWRYHPATNTLSNSWNGVVTIWLRPGGQAQEPPALYLRVNYGHDWVESFYEGEHSVWVTVTDGDGNVKGTTEAVTNTSGYFHTEPSDWLNADGNPLRFPPDFLPNDWVYSWIDNGVGAQVQIGNISGTIDLDADSLQGTVSAPWYAEEVGIECHSWGAPLPEEILKYVSVQPDGEDTYLCSWQGEWDIQPGQDVGAAYFGPDGHWVANSFRVPNPHFRVFLERESIDGGDWPEGSLVTAHVSGKPECSASDVAGSTVWSPDKTFIAMNFPASCNVEAGDSVTVSDGATSRTHTVHNLAIRNIDKVADIVTGMADAGMKIHVYAHGFEGELKPTSGVDGAWLADFGSGGNDLVEGTCIRAEIRDEVNGSWNGATAVEVCAPNPSFTVFPEWDALELWGWSRDVPVRVSIDDPQTPDVPDFEAEYMAQPVDWDPLTTYLWLDIAAQYNIKPGDQVTLSDEVTIRAHTVRNLTITKVDEEANTVVGAADEGALVHAWVHDWYDETETQLTANDGTWLVDFNSIDFDIVEGMAGRAEIRDESGNATAVDWRISRPWLNAFPEWDTIYSYGWPVDSEVDLAINGQFVQTVTVGPASWDPNTYTAYFTFKDLYDLKPGDVVVLSGSGMELTYTVQNLAITAVDKNDDTVSGTADMGAEIYIWPFATWQQLQVTADDQGKWQVDFTDVFDLIPGECGRSEIRDELGNSTAVDWCIPNPVMFAFPEGDFAEGFNWQVGDLITLRVGNLTTEATVGPAPWDPSLSYVRFNLQVQGYDLKAGDLVTMTDGQTIKELIVSPLTITDFNLGADTVSGRYDPALGLWMNVNGQNPSEVIYNGDTWEAHFSNLGPLMWGTAVQGDLDGDETRIGVRTPNPVFYAVPDEERIYAAEWTPGETLRININGAEIASRTVPSNGSLYGPEVLFDLNGVYDLQFGDVLTLADGRSSKELIVATLQVTGFDLGTHTIFGIADPGPLFVGVNGEDMQITVGEDGTWEASSPSFEPLEWGSVIRTDEDGDQTRDIFMIPRPMIYAFADDNVVVGTVWTEGQPLTLQVYDSLSGELAYERTEIVPPPSVVPWTAVDFYLQDAGYDLKPGDRLVMSQNGYERELILSSIQVTGFDIAAQTVFGTGDPGANFLIRIQGFDIWSTVKEDGTWSVYHDTLQPGEWGEAIQPDADGDETRDDFQAPSE